MDVIALEALKGWRYAANTSKKYNWACTAYNEWKEDILDSIQDGLEDVALADITKPQMLEKHKFCNSLCKFITEVRKVKGGVYPPQTVRVLILSIQMYLRTCRVNWRLLKEEDDIFIDLFNVVDNVMKERTDMGLGKVISAISVTNATENEICSITRYHNVLNWSKLCFAVRE